MNAQDLKYFKTKLLNEKKLLEEELATVGRKDPANPKDWQATVDDSQVDNADENEVADVLEEYQEHKAILAQLETQLNEVQAALQKIEDGKYGICEISGEEIERERLEANPSARTSVRHMGK